MTAEVREFLCAGTRTGKLGFTAADGRPLVAPVWFVVEVHGLDRVVLIQHSLDYRCDNPHLIDAPRRRQDTFSVVALVDVSAPGLEATLRIRNLE